MAGALTIQGFISQITKQFVILPDAEHAALQKAASIVLKETKSIPGEYQGGAGPFAAWAPLAASTLEDKARKGLPSPSPELRTGELRDSYEKNVGPLSARVGSNSDLAVWQELGTSKMQPRSIVGLAAARKEKEVVKVITHTVVAALSGQNFATLLKKL